MICDCTRRFVCLKYFITNYHSKIQPRFSEWNDVDTSRNTKNNNSASQRATSRLASAVIVRLLIFMSLRFLSFNDPLADHLFQKMMFAPPYVQDIYDAAFCGEWIYYVFNMTLNN